MHRYLDEAERWAQIADDIEESNIGDEAGFSVDLSDDGTYLAVGSAFNDNTVGASAGHVRIYNFTAEGWKQKGADIDGLRPYEYSGSSLALANFDDPGGAADVPHLRPERGDAARPDQMRAGAAMGHRAGL